MSNDLISRVELSKKICNKECGVSKFETEVELNAKQIAVMECLSDIPTAYDVDKVVERLEGALLNLTFHKDDNSKAWNRAIHKAIEIVKSGGIEWNW